MQRIERLLAHRLAIPGCVVVACLLGLPTLGIGLMIDDYLLLSAVRGAPGVWEPATTVNLFDFTGQVSGRELTDRGMLPWWTDPDHRLAFWRPLVSLTHRLDFSLWPDRPWLMHLHSVVWLALLVAVVAALQRRVIGATWVAGLAALLYAVDDARAITLGWTANRNGLVAAFFAFAALLLHLRWRERGSRSAALLAPCALLAGLLAGEGAVAVGAYFVGYAVFLDRGPAWRRVRSLLPATAVVVGWYVAYSAGGYGASNSALYIDPLRSPVAFAAAALVRAPALLLGQWALPPSDLFVLPFLRNGVQLLLWVLALAVIVGLGRLLWPLLRRRSIHRFWAFSSVVAVLPSCASGPADRLLVYAGVGASALLAGLLASIRSGEDYPPGAALRRFARPAGAALIVIHLGIAPVLLVANPWIAYRLWQPVERAGRSAAIGDRADTTVVIVNPRHQFLPMYLPLLRALDGQSVPSRVRSLGPTSGFRVPIRLRRTDERTLIVRPRNGFPTLAHRGASHRLLAGDRVELPGMTVVVREVNRRGWPQEVAYVFDVPLEHDSLVWLQRRGDGLAPVTPPAVGETLVIDGPPGSSRDAVRRRGRTTSARSPTARSSRVRRG